MMSGSMFTVPPRGWWLACFSAYIRSEHVSTWFAQGRDRRDREAGKGGGEDVPHEHRPGREYRQSVVLPPRKSHSLQASVSRRRRRRSLPSTLRYRTLWWTPTSRKRTCELTLPCFNGAPRRENRCKRTSVLAQPLSLASGVCASARDIVANW